MASEWRAAYAGAKGALTEALAVRHPQFQAEASSLLAQVLTLQSQFRLAAQLANRARAAFAELQDPAGAADAMLTLSYVESALGHAESAAAAAAQVSAGNCTVQRREASGLTYRGIAAIWRGDYGTARGVLDSACELSPQEVGSGAAAFQPLVNAIFAEVLRSAELRMKGNRSELTQLEALLAEAWKLAKTGSTKCLVSISALPGMFLLCFSTCFYASRSGQSARADKYYLKCLEHASRLPETSWMQALVLWARLERSIAAREVHEAVVSAGRMLVVAGAGEHEPMKALARRLGSEAQNYLGSAASPYATYM
ncbi:hypothetical protein [Ramlibacter alkalitolerans]|uniref:Uncharacterized protein n=1 Tax=Ramlibacter alkalitolerans TaxID=2039631 RepID=A0ABS1JQ37_9BURK|nr:hypothetical protein [Ramlibacter alkalitolerans]MBL0426362.1 hypothetical protein [Ramlibacter alkalitolerans]